MLRRPPPQTIDDELTLKLPDGRLLGYAEYGDPGGRPVVFFHGWPGSRITGMSGDAAAKEAGVRLISIERPCFGLSDDHPGRTIAGWPDDVAHAADALGLGRFSVLGWSGGGPYAAACAWKLADRLDGCVIFAGTGPFDGAVPGRNFADVKSMLNLAHRRPWVLGPAMSVFAFFLQRFPGRAMQSLFRSMPPADREIFNRPERLAMMGRSSQEAFRHGPRGPAQEIRLFTRPWGFDLAGIPMEVHIWQGEDDLQVPMLTAERMCEAIPRCTLHRIPNAGHFWIIDHWAELFETLLAAAEGRAAERGVAEPAD